jgi:hypothetical protein
MLPGGARYFFTRPLLLLLLAVDLAFIVVHVWFWFRGGVPDKWNLGLDGSFPEKFQYAKWIVCTALCAWAFARAHEALDLAWAALFFYFLLDDSLNIHETLSWSIARSLQLAPAYGLRAKDFGEFAVSLIAGAVLLGLIALCYWRSEDGPARSLTRALLPWLCLLVFSGVGLDIVLRQIRAWHGGGRVALIGRILEDGGEMSGASLLTATVVLAVVYQKRWADGASKRPGPGP